MTFIDHHLEKNIIRVQLKQNIVLKEMRDSEMAALEPHLEIVDCNKGDFLLHQGVHEMEQYFICLLYTSPSPRDRTRSRMPSSA